MNDDLGRALDDLADAAARTASRGIVAEPSVGPTLARLTTAVRRRRAAKTAGAGLLALALIGVTAGAVHAGIDRRGTVPIVPPPVTTLAPSPTAAPLSGLVCGASDEVITEMSDPVTHPPLAGITAPAIAATATEAPLPTTFTIDNLSADQMSYLTMQPRLVVLKDHVVVGWGLLEGGSRGPAMAGESTDAFMKNRLQACVAAGSALFQGDGGVLAPGEYGIAALVDAYPIGGGPAVTAVGGPFAVSLVALADVVPPPAPDPIDAYFACGKAPTVSERSLPDVAGLRLAADIPTTTWSQGYDPGWSGVLTGADSRVVVGQVSSTLKLVFVGQDGRVAAQEVSGDFAWQQFSVSSGAPAGVLGGGELNPCDGNSLANTYVALPPGTYTAWPYARVTIDTITHPDGTTEAAPTGVQIVIGTPTQVTIAN